MNLVFKQFDLYKSVIERLPAKMKIISFILLALILLEGCDSSFDEIVNPTGNNSQTTELENYNYDVIKLPKRSVSWMDSIFSMSKNIDGTVGGKMLMEKFYISEDGDSVFIEADLTIPKGAFQGVKTITMTVDTQNATVQFFPEMVFNKALKLSQYFKGINLDDYPNGTIDFYYILNDESVELIEKNGIQVVHPQGLLRVLNAKLQHFSRYGWIRKSAYSE